ncbi:unnamed protein product [Brassica oleracea var. botrytis]
MILQRVPQSSGVKRQILVSLCFGLSQYLLLWCRSSLNPFSLPYPKMHLFCIQS